MSESRSYDEAEVADILLRAAEIQENPERPEGAAAARTSPGSLTLTEIQEIGHEVGIDPSSIARSARELDRPAPAAEARFLGAPRSVSRIVALDRDLTDDEWMRLVARLRETFGARGRVEVVGPLRTWYNGNLQIHVEPTEEGHRVRMSTLKGNAAEMGSIGLAFLALAAFMGLLIFLKKGLDVGLVMPAAFALLGMGFPAAVRLALPRWAEKRRSQMDAIASEIPRLMGN